MQSLLNPESQLHGLLPRAGTTPGAPGWGICSHHVGPQHLQDVVIVHACLWKCFGGGLFSREVCPSRTLEKVNHHTPPLQGDALVDRV